MSSETEGARKLVEIVVLILLCLQHIVVGSTYVVHGVLRLGCALAAVSSPVKLLISGVFTQQISLRTLKVLFLSEFGDLEPFSDQEYFRFRLMFVVDGSFRSRLSVLRRVSCFVVILEC